MADHSMGPVYYGKKLVKLLGLNEQQELAWQLANLEELSPSLISVVEQALSDKGIV
jgi:hypothetical protein